MNIKTLKELPREITCDMGVRYDTVIINEKYSSSFELRKLLVKISKAAKKQLSLCRSDLRTIKILDNSILSKEN